MKFLILAVFSIVFIGCASTQKIVVDPKKRGEQEKARPIDECKSQVQQYGRVDVQMWDKCMEARGYKLEYVEVQDSATQQ